MKSLLKVTILLVVCSLLVAACSPAASPAPAQAPEEEEPAAAVEEEEPAAAAEEEEPAVAEEEVAEAVPPDDLILCPGAAEVSMVDTSGYASEPPWTIGVSNISLANIWRVQLMAEFEATADRHPELVEELIITDAGGDAAKQISDVEDLLARGVDALIITPASPTALNPVIERAYDQGIPVIVFSTDATTEKVTARVQPNYCEFSTVSAQWLVDTLDGSGQIVALRGIAGNSAEEDEWNCAMSVFENYPDIEVLGYEFADWAYDQGKRASESLLAAYPEFDGVYSLGDQMSWAMVEAMVEANRPLVPITAIGGGNGFQKTRLEYDFPAIDVVDPTWISETALEVALQVLQGQSVPDCQSVAVQMITDDVVADYARPDLPDGFNAGSHLPEEYIEEIFSE
jgi:ribose transport system substrate-binding protein